MKQVRLLDRRDVPVELFYGADLSANQDVASFAAQRTLRTKNDAAHHLGLPLPSGQVATFATGNDSTLLLDEVPLRDIAVNEDVEIGVGTSADVQVSAVREQTNVSPRKAMEPPLLRGILRFSSAVVDDISRVEIHNAGRSAIHFELRLRLNEGTQLIRAEPTPMSRDGRPLFKVVVPANGSAVVRYQTEHTE